MESTYSRNRVVWSTSNGLLVNSRPTRTPGNQGNHTSIAGQIAGHALQRNGNNAGGHAGDIEDGGGAFHKRKAVHSNFIGIQSKFRRKYYHKVLLGSLTLLIIILLIIIIILSIKSKRYKSLCISKDCIRTAASLVYAMDEQTDPCEDFYKFTCGNWANEHPRPDTVTSNDWFRERQAHIMRTLREFLQAEVEEGEPEAVGKVKLMYKSCMDTELLDKRGLEPLVNYLREFKLPLVPSGLNITLSPESAKKHGLSTEKDAEKFDWLQSVVQIKKILGMDSIIGFDVFPDPLNRTINRIALGTPETDSALPFNDDDIHKLLRKVKRKTVYENQDNDEDVEVEEEKLLKQTTGLKAYVAYVKKVMQIYLKYLDPDIDTAEVESGANELALGAIKVAKILFKFKEEAENSTKPTKLPVDDLIYTTVPDLQNQTDKLIAPKSLPIWERYMRLIFAQTNHSEQFIKDIRIITSQPDISYLQSVVEYLSDVPHSQIEFFLWLNTVEELILHTTREMRVLHLEYMRLVLNTEGSTPRSLYCAHGVNSLMGMAVSYVMVDDVFAKVKLPRVERMLNDIRHAFDNLVHTVSWMDKATKRVTLEKSASMKSFIGFPEWLSNDTALDAFYKNVHINESMHLENMIGVLRWQMHEKINNFHKPDPFGWATSPTNVNAFHTFQANTITVPIAILQFPFYELGIEALNYGSIGTILGHELTHGFDDSGRMFDKDGNMRQWWSNETIKEYINRTDCFVDQYNHFYLDDIGEYIDGELTLGENIADNGGMREAFHAYKRFIKEVGDERYALPGLEHYTHEQLFFISFGNLWCETYTPAASRYAWEDTHCPGRFRLKGVLTNSEEFSQVFKCPRGSGMNPLGEKCRLW